MTPGLVARQLGFGSADRIVVMHADDVGMCHGTLEAFDAVVARGAITASSAMVPCGWFPSVATWCREHTDTADVGIHLTLNSEWTTLRWRPVSGTDVASLADESGCFVRSPETLLRQAEVRDVYIELRAQIAAALADGVDVTHIDSHIFVLRHPRFIETYARLAREFRVPCGLIRRPDPEIERLALPSREADAYYRVIDEAERDGLAVFDAWVDLPLNEPRERRLDTGRRVLDGLPEGVSVVLFHPAIDSPEVRAISPDWPARVGDYELLMSDAWARAVEASGVRVIGMRAIRDALFGAPAAAASAAGTTRT